MECRFPTTSAAPILLLVLATLPVQAGTPPAAAPIRAPAEVPVLRVAGNDFPQLVMHIPRHDALGVQAVLDCDQIRAKRIDELDPLWKKAVERIHLDCDDLGGDAEGIGSVATVATAYLKPGAVQFAGIPVVEVRMMESDLWGDRQYLLERGYAEIVDAVQAHLESQCRMRQDDPGLLAQGDCSVLRQAEGLYLETSEIGGTWLHPDQDDTQRTVYAEAWAD
jgi:hypothetical protein